MNDFPRDPDSLAEALDRALPPDGSAPAAHSDDPRIAAAQRLRSAPRPALSPAADARIRAAMGAARPFPVARGLRPLAVSRYGLAAAVLLVVVGAVFAVRVGLSLIQPTPAPTAPLIPVTPTPPAPSLIPVTPTPPAPSLVPVTPTPPAPSFVPVTPTPPAPSFVPVTPTPPVPSLVPVTPTPPATPSLPVIVLLEGPVQSIDGAVIVVFDLTFTLDPDDPALATLQPGDPVRIEASTTADSAVFTAVRVTRLVRQGGTAGSSETHINPDSGAVWQDNGDCSNPPPPWAPAHGWRRRCEGGAAPGNSGGQGRGNGQGRP